MAETSMVCDNLDQGKKNKVVIKKKVVKKVTKQTVEDPVQEETESKMGETKVMDGKKKVVKKKAAEADATAADSTNDDRVEEATAAGKKIVVKKKVVKVVRKKKADTAQADEEAEQAATEPKPKRVVKKVVKVVKRSTSESKQAEAEAKAQDETGTEKLKRKAAAPRSVAKEQTKPTSAKRKQDQDRGDKDDDEEEEEKEDCEEGKEDEDDIDQGEEEQEEAKVDRLQGRKEKSERKKTMYDDLEEENLDDDSSGTGSMLSSDRSNSIPRTLDFETLSEMYVEKFSAVQNAERDMSDRIRTLRGLLYSPVPEGVTFKCQIDRHYDQSGEIYYSFILPVERGDGLRDKRMTLMMAKVRSSLTMKPTYVISLEPIDFHKNCASRSERYFGKLQNVSEWGVGNSQAQYVLYDDGYNPDKANKGKQSDGDDITSTEQSSSPSDTLPLMYPRKQLASVIFASARRTPDDLKMTVALPHKDKVEEKADINKLFTCLAKKHRFVVQERIAINKIDFGSMEEIDSAFVNSAELSYTSVRSIPVGTKKRPAMSEESRFPVAPSVKNFELARSPVSQSSTPDMGLARIGQERFFTVIRAPFSPFEAFGVCLSRFDHTDSVSYKLASKGLL